MKRLIVILALVMSTAAAAQSLQPPSWSPHGGWDNFDRQAREAQQAHDERAAEMRRNFEERSREMDEEFDRDSRRMFLLFGAFAVAAIVIGGITAVQKKRRALAYPIEVSYEPLAAMPQVVPSGTDVGVLRVAIDGRAAKFVQTELARIVEQCPGDTRDGRAKRLRETSVLMRRVRDSWLYGGAVNEPMRPRDAALAMFHRHVDDARVRFTSTATPVATSSDSTTLVLVTIVVAARGELATVSQIGAGEDLRRALEAAAYREPDELLAVEIVWVPSEPDRKLTSHQLESFYPPPDLYRLQGALGNKAFCSHCNGPYPHELVTCPHCGAPAPGRAA